ncbi:MAG: hypothetical protein JXA07_15480 [Spirochaetes bacterium]|nr:hypothetical protein [Spirochaetota bacterium]
MVRISPAPGLTSDFHCRNDGTSLYMPGKGPVVRHTALALPNLQAALCLVMFNGIEKNLSLKKGHI